MSKNITVEQPNETTGKNNCKKCEEIVKELLKINYYRTYNWICPDCNKVYPVSYEAKEYE